MGLPAGLLLLTVYAPQADDTEAKAEFTRCMLAVVHGLDMQLPTLLMGDFNASTHVERDFGIRRPKVCPLLTALLGPGRPFVDLLVEVSPEEHQWTYRCPSGVEVHSSRIDLILGKRAARPLVCKVWVQADIRDGSHSRWSPN